MTIGVSAADRGGSQHVKDVTSKDFASDITVLFDHLVTQPDIDASKIGLVGHSEAGSSLPWWRSGVMMSPFSC